MYKYLRYSEKESDRYGVVCEWKLHNGKFYHWCGGTNKWWDLTEEKICMFCKKELDNFTELRLQLAPDHISNISSYG